MLSRGVSRAVNLSVVELLSDDGSRMLSFGVEEGEAEKVIEEESSHIPTPSTARALENTTTSSRVTHEGVA